MTLSLTRRSLLIGGAASMTAKPVLAHEMPQKMRLSAATGTGGGASAAFDRDRFVEDCIRARYWPGWGNRKPPDSMYCCHRRASPSLPPAGRRK